VKTIDLTPGVLLLLLALAFSCSKPLEAAPVRAEASDHVRVDAGQTSTAARQNTGNPDASGYKTSKLPRVEMGDCPAICEKLQRCKEGPFDAVSECTTACEAAIDDPTSARTYRCLARATDCRRIRSCGH